MIDGKYHKKPRDGQYHKNAAGYIYTTHDLRRVSEKAQCAPATLTDEDLGILESFDGTRAADKAADARARARNPSAAPAQGGQTLAGYGASMSLKEATDFLLELIQHTPEPDFNRAKCEADIRDRIERSGSIVAGEYDPVKFLVARKQYDERPTDLTDADIRQLAIVDETLAKKATAARAGFSQPVDAELNAALSQMPVSALALFEFVAEKVGQTNQLLQTTTRLARELRVRIDAIEKRLGDPNDVPAMAVQLEPTIKRLVNQVAMLDPRVRGMDLQYERKIKELVAKVDALERRHEIQYHGVFQEGTTYKAGSAVTWAGSLWIAMQETTATPSEAGTASRAWRLAVKRGAPGRDAK